MSHRISVAIFLLGSALCAFSAEIYSGEPLAEALHDLSSYSAPVAHKLSSASSSERRDVFQLEDGRLLAIGSKANALREPFSIVWIRVTPTPAAPLTLKLPPVSTVKLDQKK